MTFAKGSGSCPTCSTADVAAVQGRISICNRRPKTSRSYARQCKTALNMHASWVNFCRQNVTGEALFQVLGNRDADGKMPREKHSNNIKVLY